MASIKSLRITGYRSIKEEIEINFPKKCPLVLLGENNAGKSNIIRAIDILQGEMWPGSKDPEDHDFWDRDCKNGKIEIEADFDDLTYKDNNGNEHLVSSIYWYCDPSNSDNKVEYRANTLQGARYVSNELRNGCICMVLGADRRLNYQLSYSSKYTLLSKLMRKFHSSLISDDDRVNNLKDKFDEIVEIFHEVEDFANFKESLSNNFTELLKSMSYGLQIDFSAYDPSNFFHSLKVFPTDDDIRTFDELGTGQEQLLALSFAHAYAKAFYGGIVLILEEPEAHLHPLAQEWLSRKITQMSRDGLQIVLTTHSPAFVKILNMEGMVLVRKKDKATEVKQISVAEFTKFCIDSGVSENKVNETNILPFYHVNSTREIMAGLFAKKVVLVEGYTESLSLPIYLFRSDLDVYNEGIAIIPVFGKGNLAKWWRFFNAYGIPTYIIFDNDNQDDKNEAKRKEFLQTLGLNSEEVESTIKIEECDVKDKYCVFGNNIETTFRKSFSNYEELEKEARTQIGDSKPLIARYVATKLEKNDSPGWEKLREMCEIIKSL